MSAFKVMIVEEDPLMLRALRNALLQHGHQIVATSDTAVQVSGKIKIYAPEILLVNVRLQGNANGIEVVRFVQTRHQLPCIFISHADSSDVIEAAKKAEPYGFLIKPCMPNMLHAAIEMAMYRYCEERKRREQLEVLQREKAHLEKLLFRDREEHERDNTVVSFGEKYAFDIFQCETYFQGEKIRLTKKENAFMRLLVAQIGKVVRFDQVIHYVWEEKGATENSVRTLVWRLRNKLPTQVIHNASGIGYYLEEA